MIEILFQIFLGGSILSSFLLLYIGIMFYIEGEQMASRKAILISLIVLLAGLLIFIYQVEIAIYISMAILFAAISAESDDSFSGGRSKLKKNGNGKS